MLKTITLLSVRPGLTQAAFRHHYESIHVPLIESLVAEIVQYRRNYVRPEGRVSAARQSVHSDSDFDVLTETWIPHQGAVRQMMGRLAAGDGERIARDEALFADRDRIRIIPVEEVVSPPEVLGPGSVQTFPGACKALTLLKARPGMSRRYFIERFEADYMPAMLAEFRDGSGSLFAGHARNYLIHGKRVELDHVAHQALGLDCDVIITSWFRNSGDLKRFLDRSWVDQGSPTRARQLEKKLIEPSRTLILPVDEYVSGTQHDIGPGGSGDVHHAGAS